MRKGRNKIHVARHIDPLQRSANIVPSRPEWPTSAGRTEVWSPGAENPGADLLLQLCGSLSVSLSVGAHQAERTERGDKLLFKFGQTVCVFFLIFLPLDSSSSLHFHRLGVILRITFPTEHSLRVQVWISLSLSAPVMTDGSHTSPLFTSSSFFLPFSFARQTSPAHSNSRAKNRLLLPVLLQPSFSSSLRSCGEEARVTLLQSSSSRLAVKVASSVWQQRWREVPQL